MTVPEDVQAGDLLFEPRWWRFRARRRLRRIANLEAAHGIWPPWHYVRTSWYDMSGGGGYDYRLPRPTDKGHA